MNPGFGPTSVIVIVIVIIIIIIIIIISIIIITIYIVQALFKSFRTFFFLRRK